MLERHPGGAQHGAGDEPRVDVVLDLGADPPGDGVREGPLDHGERLQLLAGQGGRGRDEPRLAQVDFVCGEALDDRVGQRRPQRLIGWPGGQRRLHPRRAMVRGGEEGFFLAGEVVVERAGGHPRLGGDVLHPDLIPAPQSRRFSGIRNYSANTWSAGVGRVSSISRTFRASASAVNGLWISATVGSASTSSSGVLSMLPEM